MENTERRTARYTGIDAEKRRLKDAMNGVIPDKVPHFELVFQVPEQAFGLSWPTEEEVMSASPRERDALYERWFEINERILDRYHWAAIAAPLDFFGCRDHMLADARARLGDRALIYDWNGNGVFWLMDGDDMMDFSVRMYEEPEDVHAQAREKCERSKALARRQADQGADFICINSDFGFNTGPFISPSCFKEFVTPYLTEIVACIHDLGLRCMLHSDGNLNLILDQLVSSGIDGLQSIDPQGHMDLSRVKREYGERLFLMGNVHTALLQDGDEAVIRALARDAISVGRPGGRYIFSTSNCIFRGMPLMSYHIMLDEYEKCAWYIE